MKVKRILVLLAVSIIAILLVGCSEYHEMTCDYCGKDEQCKSYTGQYVAGYNNDGSIKYGHETLWLSDECYSKAKNSGKWLNIDRLN